MVTLFDTASKTSETVSATAPSVAAFATKPMEQRIEITATKATSVLLKPVKCFFVSHTHNPFNCFIGRMNV